MVKIDKVELGGKFSCYNFSLCTAGYLQSAKVMRLTIRSMTTTVTNSYASIVTGMDHLEQPVIFFLFALIVIRKMGKAMRLTVRPTIGDYCQW